MGEILRAFWKPTLGDLKKQGLFSPLLLLPFLVYSYSDFSSSDGLDFEGLQILFEKNSVTTIEEALKSIKKKYPSLFDRYVLMYRSRSLQQASPMAPRAIVYGHSAKLIFAFNGKKDQRGYSNLEVVQFRDATHSFEFREIEFKKGEPPKYSLPNPPKCLKCHQSPDRKDVDPHPNWEPYSIWPGAYGSNAGSLVSSSTLHYNDHLKDEKIYLQEQAGEEKNIQRFLKTVKSSDKRYQYLGDFNPDQTTALTEVLGYLNFRRIVRIVKSASSIYPHYKYSFAGLGNCSMQGYMVPEEILGWHKSRLKREEFFRISSRTSEEESAIRDAAAGELEISEEDRKKFLKELENTTPVPEPVQVSPGLVTLFEPLGLSTEDWSMDFKTQGKFAFRERFGMPSNAVSALSSAFKMVDPELSQMGCDELKRRSFENLTAFHKSDAFTEVVRSVDSAREAPRAPLIQHCTVCHASGSSYPPPIPFNDRAKLSIALTQGGYPRGRLIDEIKYRLGDLATLEEQMPPQGARRDERINLSRELEDLVPAFVLGAP